MPSITANETWAQCLPLGHRQLQVPIIQCWSWIKDKLFCRVSVATIHQPVIQGTYCARSRVIFNYCQLLNYPRCVVLRSSLCCMALLPVWLQNVGFLYPGTWDQKQNLWFWWFFVSWSTTCDKLNSVLLVLSLIPRGKKVIHTQPFWIACVCVDQSWSWVEHSNQKCSKAFDFLWTDFKWSCSKQNVWPFQWIWYSTQVFQPWLTGIFK